VKAQIGIRFALVLLPLFYIFAGSLLKEASLLSVRLKAIFVFLLTYLAVSMFSYYPHYLSYFNESVWDRKMAYKVLADSNIDWGQGKKYFKEYMKNNPDAQFEPSFPIPGKIVVGVNKLTGVIDRGKYRWLKDNFEPVGHIGHSYLVYQISLEDFQGIAAKESEAGGN
jgi:hypothetical protein